MRDNVIDHYRLNLQRNLAHHLELLKAHLIRIGPGAENAKGFAQTRI
jgi:hypothetical protein